jgi:protein required for attachment to host cells
MNEIRIKNGDWVVICDGRKALLTINVGDGEYLNLKVLEEHEHKSPPTHEQGSDRPGRVQQSAGSGGNVGRGGSRSGVAQTDWHERDEREFLRTIAERINRGVKDNHVKGLVIAAPPKALGVLKPLLSPATSALLRGTLDKDYVNMPVYDIERQLTPKAKAPEPGPVPRR